MKHRLYQSDSLEPGDNYPYTFIEVDPDGFMEVNAPRMSHIDDVIETEMLDFINRILTTESMGNVFYFRMSRRYFTMIHPVPNLRLIGEIER